MGWTGYISSWPQKVLHECQLPPSTGPGQPEQRPHSSLTWQEEGGPGGDVDLLQVLQRLCVEEADGGTGGEGHPDATARFHHVCHTHSLILVRLKALLQTEWGVLVQGWACQPNTWGPSYSGLCLNHLSLVRNPRSPAVACW